MKRILLILTFLSLCGQMNAQATESCMAVVKELTMQKNVWSDQKAIDYIINHADSFDKNKNKKLQYFFYKVLQFSGKTNMNK